MAIWKIKVKKKSYSEIWLKKKVSFKIYSPLWGGGGGEKFREQWDKGIIFPKEFQAASESN